MSKTKDKVIDDLNARIQYYHDQLDTADGTIKGHLAVIASVTTERNDAVARRDELQSVVAQQQQLISALIGETKQASETALHISRVADRLTAPNGQMTPR